ncbi:MAG: ECF transporter S component [Ruminococcus sp.]|nr:ECF transporter S component [Ruminococcus sp.]
MYVISLILIPIVILLGTATFGKQSYPAVSCAVALLACVPFFLTFEREKNTRKIVFLAVMVALSVAGRFIFAPVQFFKPVAAIVILAGMYFGAQFGFLTGALSAVVSDFYFGQGPWTPFQMFSWGLIGLLAGLLSSRLIRSKILLIIFGAFSGALFSLIMDVWTVLSLDGGEFNLSRFSAAVATSLPIIGIYVVSNIIFLLILSPLFGKKIERIKTKYGI